MKKILYIIMILFSSNSLAEMVHYNKIGDTIYGSDGSRLTQIGDTYYSNNGTSYNKIGNTVYGSDGSRLTQIGNTYYSNNGTSYNKIGNTIYGSDGSRLTSIVNTQYATTSAPNYYDTSSSDSAGIATAIVGVIAIGALIGIAVSNHNEEVERQFRNHLMTFEKKVMTLPLY